MMMDLLSTSRQDFSPVRSDTSLDGESGALLASSDDIVAPSTRGGVGRLAGTAVLACSAVACVVLTRPPTHHEPRISHHLLQQGAIELNVVPSSTDGGFLQPLSESEFAPLGNLHDGNPCDENEEMFMGLCYKKCSILTHGIAAVRTSSWTCCEGHPCGVTNQHGDMGKSLMCAGYDVDGNGGCPHKPGTCLTDEEMHVGICYKKCSLLTDNEYPYRSAASTCCKMGSAMSCLNPMHTKTDAAFNVGGGQDIDARVHPPETALTEASGSPAAVSTTPGLELTAEAMKPKEHLHDGNVCDDTEELYGGLCYKRCSLLSEGKAPIRTSSWTCCESHPCGIWNQLGSLGTTLLCNGYDVGGNGGCPHKPGACLADEEMYLGVCYKMCSLLTNGEFPHRVAAATCCKTHGIGCLNPWNDKTSNAFDLGGGASGDQEAVAHLPETSLTEASDQQVSYAQPSVVAAADDDSQGVGSHAAPTSAASGAEAAAEDVEQRAAIIAALK